MQGLEEAEEEAVEIMEILKTEIKIEHSPVTLVEKLDILVLLAFQKRKEIRETEIDHRVKITKEMEMPVGIVGATHIGQETAFKKTS